MTQPASTPPPSKGFARDGLHQLASVLRGRSLIVVCVVVAAVLGLQAIISIALLSQQHPTASSHGYEYGPNVGSAVVSSAVPGVRQITVSPDGTLFGLADTELIVLDPVTLSPIASQPLPVPGWGVDLRASGNGTVFVTLQDENDNQQVQKYLVDANYEFLEGGRIDLSDFDFTYSDISADGALVYLPALTGDLLSAFDSATAEESAAVFVGGAAAFTVTAADISGTVFVTSLGEGSTGDEVVAYTSNLKRELARFEIGDGWIDSVNANGDLICLSDGTILGFDGEHFSEVARVKGYCGAFVPDGSAVILTGEEKFTVADATTGDILFTIRNDAYASNPVALQQPELGFVSVDNGALYRYQSDAPQLTLMQLIVLFALINIALLVVGVSVAFLLPAVRHRRETAPQRRQQAEQKAALRRDMDAIRARAAQQSAQQAEHDSRVLQLAKWEAAYSQLHPGQPIPAMPTHFAVAVPTGSPANDRTNTMAILALVFGFGGGLLGIVFGHAARSQIRKSGEKGWGLATAGLVFGYLGLIVFVSTLVIVIVVATTN